MSGYTKLSFGSIKRKVIEEYIVALQMIARKEKILYDPAAMYRIDLTML